jgi:hypothetical protein
VAPALTGNPNAYFELEVAIGAGKCMILVVGDRGVVKVPG